MSDEPPPPVLFGIAEQEFMLWKHHPVTKLVWQFISDFRSEMVRIHLDEWAAGKIEAVRDLEQRGRVLQLDDLHELSFASMVNFYPQPDQKRTDETASA